MRYVSLMLCLLFTNLSLFADEPEFDWNNTSLYRRYLSHTSYEVVGLNTVAIIECSDNTSWKLIANPENEMVLYSLQEQLTEGSEVFFTEVDQTPYYWIGKANSSKFKVSACKESLASLPKIVSIEHIVISEPGWFTYGQYKHILTLSDNSVWEIQDGLSWHYQTAYYYWKPGQHIFISHCGHFPEHKYLINLEACHCQYFDRSYYIDDQYIYEASCIDFRVMSSWNYLIELIKEPS